MRITMTPIKPRKNLFDYKLYEPEIREAVEDTGEAVKSALDEVVADWEHQPDFRKRLTVRAATVSVDVYASGENAAIFNYVDKGTRPHIIRPKSRPRLLFRTGYVPHTTPARGYGGPGTAEGPWALAAEVHHPGNAPRGFIRTIMDANRDTFREAVADAIREAQR